MPRKATLLQEREIPHPCPTCPPHKPSKCSLNTAKGVWHCFRCGSAGRANTSSSLGMLVSPGGEAPKYKPATSFPYEYRELSCFATRWLGGVRGIDPRLVRQLPIYSTDHGILFHFPDFGYWQHRAWRASSLPKYLAPKAPRASDGVVYEIPVPGTEIVLVEGVLDALKVASAGYPCAAMLSKVFYSPQAYYLGERYDRAVVLLDSDVPESHRMRQVELCSEHFSVTRSARLETSSDPGEAPLGEIRAALAPSRSRP